MRKRVGVQELGLPAGTPVGTCLIDAHAGGVGVLEGVPSHLHLLPHPPPQPSERGGGWVTKQERMEGEGERVGNEEENGGAGRKGGLSERMVMVCGTSTCHLAVNERRLHVPGVWGPYWSGERGRGWGEGWG